MALGPDERSKSPQVRTKLDKDRERDRDSAKDREREREKEKEREKEEKKEEKREKEKERRALSRHPSAPSSQPPTLLLSSSAPAMAPSLSSLPPVSARTREEEQRKADRSKASAANGMTGRSATSIDDFSVQTILNDLLVILIGIFRNPQMRVTSCMWPKIQRRAALS